MTEGPESTTPTAPSSPSLESWVSTMDGQGFVTEPEREPADAGAPPATTDDAAPTGTEALGSEGTAEAAPTGAPPVEAAATPPDKAVTPPDDDPLAGATPLAYTVNGEARTVEGIKILGEHGAVVDKAYLPTLIQRLSERDHYFEKDRASGQRIQELERLTEWRTQDANGQNVTLTGLKGVEAQRVQLGRSMAALNTISQAFKTSPMQLLAQDDKGNIVWDQTAISHLVTASELAEIRAEQAVRTHLSGLAETLQQTARQTEEDATVPVRLSAAVESQWMSKHPELTVPDKQFLNAQLQRYIRPATPEEQKAGLGRTVVDGSFYDVIKDRAELRSTNAKQLASVTTSTTQATKENAAKLAAAAVGKRPTAPARPATPAPKAPTQAQQREQDAGDAWDLAEQAAARMVKRQATAST